MSSTSPTDPSMEGLPSRGRDGRSEHRTDTGHDPGDFESVGYYGQTFEDDETARAERRRRARQADEQTLAAARAAHDRARYEQMGSYSHEPSHQDKRIDRTEMALAASVVVNQFQTSFPGFADNPYIKAGIRWIPTLFLKPRKREDGFGGVVANPTVWSLALVEGLTLVAEGGRVVNQLVEELGRRPAGADDLEKPKK